VSTRSSTEEVAGYTGEAVWGRGTRDTASWAGKAGSSAEVEARIARQAVSGWDHTTRAAEVAGETGWSTEKVSLLTADTSCSVWTESTEWYTRETARAWEVEANVTGSACCWSSCTDWAIFWAFWALTQVQEVGWLTAQALGRVAVETVCKARGTGYTKSTSAVEIVSVGCTLEAVAAWIAD